jgi:hypothetical protein
MKPARCPFHRVADVIILHKFNVDPDRGRVARISHLGEKASNVTNTPRHRHFDFRQRGIHDLHPDRISRLPVTAKQVTSGEVEEHPPPNYNVTTTSPAWRVSISLRAANGMNRKALHAAISARYNIISQRDNQPACRRPANQEAESTDRPRVRRGG